jgi:dual specificity protein kinase YAK1
MRIRSNFTLGNHLCIVFELLSYNLYKLLKSRSFQGLLLPVIRKIGEQLLTALEFTRRNKVIHCT